MVKDGNHIRQSIVPRYYTVNGDYLSRNAAGAATKRRLLNIRYGNGASVVVRARESLVHGEGKQLKV